MFLSKINVGMTCTKEREVDDPYSLYIKRIGRNHVDILDNEAPKNPDQLIEFAKNSILVNSNVKPDSIQNICQIAEAKIEAVEQNFELSKEILSFAKGLKENIRALPVFVKNKDFNKLFSPKFINSTKNAAKFGLVITIAATLVDCAPKNSTPDPSETFSTETLIIQTTVIATETFSETPTDIPVGSETQAPTEAAVRLPVTAEDVKNVEPSLKIGEDNEGNLTGLPEDRDYVKPFYEALAKKFSEATIYFNQSASTGQWILYAVSPEGKLYNSIVSYDGGKTEQYNDYPVDYNNIDGDYTEVDFSGGELGVIWNNGLPQFLSGKVTLPNGEYIFTKFMEYKTYADQNPWKEVPGIDKFLPDGVIGDLFVIAPDVIFDSSGLHITLSDSSRVIDVEIAKIEKQVVFDSEYNLYKIYDAEGHITAEYDPGQGKEGDANYVPSTGWVDIQKLATNLVCQEGDGQACMNIDRDPYHDNDVYFESISTGIWRYIDAKDESGNSLGRALLLQMASRDANQNPTVYWLLTEAVPKSTPDYSTYSYVPFMIGERGIDPKDYYHRVFSIEKYKEYMPKGLMLTLAFNLNGRTFLYYFDFSIETADSNVLAMLESKGESGNTLDVIMNNSGRKGRD